LVSTVIDDRVAFELVVMPTVFAVISFAVVYAFGSTVTNRVNVYYFDYWDAKFLSQAGNVAVFQQLLPIVASLATLSFLFGLTFHRSWLARAPLGQAALGGSLSGGVASFVLLADIAIRRCDGMQGVALPLGMLLFWAGPACVAASVFQLLRRYSSGP
jgi:hypothetical protein